MPTSPKFRRNPDPNPSDPADWCIHVGGEEVQADHDFQCGSCGQHVEGDEPILAQRKCPACGEVYHVHPFSVEEV